MTTQNKLNNKEYQFVFICAISNNVCYRAARVLLEAITAQLCFRTAGNPLFGFNKLFSLGSVSLGITAHLDYTHFHISKDGN